MRDYRTTNSRTCGVGHVYIALGRTFARFCPKVTFAFPLAIFGSATGLDRGFLFWLACTFSGCNIPSHDDPIVRVGSEHCPFFR